MAQPISGGSLPLHPQGSQAIGNQSTSDTATFKNLLLEGLDQVNSMQSQADQAVQQLMTGQDVNTAEVLTAVQKADMAFQLMMQIRNKMVQAFQEVKELRI